MIFFELDSIEGVAKNTLVKCSLFFWKVKRWKPFVKEMQDYFITKFSLLLFLQMLQSYLQVSDRYNS